MTKKLLLIGQGYTEVREYKLDRDKPRSDKSDGIQFNLGLRRWPFWKYDINAVILKQKDENKYKKADSPISNDDYYIVEVFKAHENNGSLIVDEGQLARWMGKTNEQIINEVSTLTDELEKNDLERLKDKKRIITTLKEVQEIFIQNEAAYSENLITNISDLSRRISDDIGDDTKEDQKAFLKTERERKYATDHTKPVPQLPETITVEKEPNEDEEKEEEDTEK